MASIAVSLCAAALAMPVVARAGERSLGAPAGAHMGVASVGAFARAGSAPSALMAVGSLPPIVLTQQATGWLARYIDAFDKHNSLKHFEAMFPNVGDAASQENYISWVARYGTPTVSGYQHFVADTTYRHAFDGQAGYWKYIAPKGVVQHWTQIRFAGVRAFISYMNNVRHLRTTYFIDPTVIPISFLTATTTCLRPPLALTRSSRTSRSTPPELSIGRPTKYERRNTS